MDYDPYHEWMADTKFTLQEQERIKILTAAIEGTVTNERAGKQLGLSIRQVQRAKAGIRKEGAAAVVHKLKGKVGNHHIDERVKERALAVIEERYLDFKPTFATEKLAENHDISVSPETTRLWMIKEGLWKPRKQKQSEYHSWRPRKDYYGELEQFDGSYHFWFEKRFVDTEGNPIEVCLLAAIDDATGKITQASFSANEGVVAVFTFWKEYVLGKGKPLSIYLDKFSTYKINHKSAVDNKDLLTQFQKAVVVLSIDLISAHSPQAKGRIERLFLTLQDRLVKEMRLASIATPEQGNVFLEEVFLPKFNNKFSVVPTKKGDIHRPLGKEEKENMDHIFSVKDTRRVNNDFTIQFKNNWYQLLEVQPTTVRPKETVLMETWLDQSIHIILKDKKLSYILLPEKPKKQATKQPTILTSHKLNYKPPPNHPWKSRTLPQRG